MRMEMLLLQIQTCAELDVPSLGLVQVPRHVSETQPRIGLPTPSLCPSCFFVFFSAVGGGDVFQHLRGQSVEATSLHLQHAILPVGPGDSEVVKGTAEDAERLASQRELGRVHR